jgi:hypothetical protein
MALNPLIEICVNFNIWILKECVEKVREITRAYQEQYISEETDYSQVRDRCCQPGSEFIEKVEPC